MGGTGLYATEDSQGAEIGEFEADMALTADFGSQTISGCAGCNGGTLIDGWNQTDYRIRLGATPFDSNGVFSGTSVRLEHPQEEFVTNKRRLGRNVLKRA